MDCCTKPKCPCAPCNCGCDIPVRPVPQPTCASAPVSPSIPVPMPVAPLPSMAGEMIDSYPVAMAYVPWQTWQQVYPLDRGFNRGTIFPELDKPFVMGRCQ